MLYLSVKQRHCRPSLVLQACSLLLSCLVSHGQTGLCTTHRLMILGGGGRIRLVLVESEMDYQSKVSLDEKTRFFFLHWEFLCHSYLIKSGRYHPLATKKMTPATKKGCQTTLAELLLQHKRAASAEPSNSAIKGFLERLLSIAIGPNTARPY